MYDIAIIGAGVIGCSILNKLTRLGKTCVLLEKNLDVSTGTTKANSGLIHAGFDCIPGTLKAKLNVQGNRLYYKLCKQLGVKIKKTGALVAGNDEKIIKELYNRGLQNGLKPTELEILNKEQILKILPNAADDINIALHAKTAGVIAPYMYTIALAEEAILNGAKIIFDFEVSSVQEINNSYKITSKNNKGLTAKTIINASGYNFNEVSNLIGAETYPLTYKRGEYFLLDNSIKNLTNLTVFPLPSKESKGILITPTIDGNYLVGPTSTPDDYNTKTTSEGLSEIKQKSANLIKNVPLNKTIRVFSGVRTSVGDDFIIEKSKLKNNVINLAGINSPGLSCAPAIANYVANLLNIKTTEKPMIKRKPYTVVKDLKAEELNNLIKTNPAYGKIVCRCENVTEGEIEEAILSPLKPTTVDGIKRRVRAGMGRCQGSFCFLRVIECLAKLHKLPLEKVNKEDKDSNFIVCDIKSEGSL